MIEKKLQYARFIHLFLQLALSLLLFLFTTLPHKWWILLTMLVVSSAVEPGLIVQRAIHRIAGTFLALFFLIPFLYFLQINYHLISVFFILAIIGVSSTTLNPTRYDRTVFFMTIIVFLLTAQTELDPSPEGPIELVINRGVCTVIGVMIVIGADFFLFKAFRYSQKLYYYHQLLLLRFLRSIPPQIAEAKQTDANHLLFIEKLRRDFTQHYNLIGLSSENLKRDLKSNTEISEKVHQFQRIVWEIRQILFAYCFSEMMLPSQTASVENFQRYKQLMLQARKYFLTSNISV